MTDVESRPRVVWEHKEGETAYRAVDRSAGSYYYERSVGLNAMGEPMWQPHEGVDMCVGLLTALLSDYRDLKAASKPNPTDQPSDDELLKLVREYPCRSVYELGRLVPNSYFDLLARLRAHPGIEEVCGGDSVSLWRPVEAIP